MDLDVLIKQIKQRPGSFLGNERNVKCLKSYIDGFLSAKAIFSNEDLNLFEKAFRELFEEFVLSKLFGITHPFKIELFEKFRFKGWDNIIILFSTTDEDAWRLFFKLYDEFSTKSFEIVTL